MDKTIEQLLRTFNHIARELQVYFLSGFLVLLNVGYIDHSYYRGTLWHHVNQQPLFIPTLIIVAYVIGHICMGVYYVLLEKTTLEERARRVLSLKRENYDAVQPSLFQKDQNVYLFFVERYVLLELMRCTLSVAFFLMALMNGGCCLYWLRLSECNCRTFILAILFFVLSLFLFVLTLVTEKEKSDRIGSLLKPPDTSK
jgi:uncharacterized membrane protein